MDETVKTKRKPRRTPKPSYAQLVILQVLRENGGKASTRTLRAALLDEGFFSSHEIIQRAYRNGVIDRLRIGFYGIPQTKTP